MNDWWKNPVLQGPENDYGDYDYLIEEIPQNTREWSRWGYKCSECGKYHKLNVVYTGYFRTMDGYDSMSSETCWVCELIRNPIHRIKWKLKRKWKLLKQTVELKHELSPKHTWKRCYELAKILQKKGKSMSGKAITEFFR